MIPKIIHMTYKTNIPDRYINAWKKLNPGYKIDFSLDIDCIQFLNNNFGEEIGNLFKRIPKGMYKADLWRLCKLYVEGGVYADVDLVPHVPINSLIKDNHTFYTALAVNRKSCFQAIIITTVKNPLVLACIFSFIRNKPWTIGNGPTFDMYNVLKKILGYYTGLRHDRVYKTNLVKININIGKKLILPFFYSPV